MLSMLALNMDLDIIKKFIPELKYDGLIWKESPQNMWLISDTITLQILWDWLAIIIIDVIAAKIKALFDK